MADAGARRRRAARFLPLWLRGDYRRADLRRDALAGLTVAVMLVPQGMAYALLGGVPPVYGLFASMVPLLVYAVIGGSRQLAAGIVALDMLIVGGAIAGAGPVTPEEAAGLALVLSAMVGAIHLALGLLRLGFVTDFISRPVIVGFTTAAPILIALGQIGNLTGMQLPRGSTLVGLAAPALAHLDRIDPASTAVGLGAVLYLAIGRRLRPRWPHALVVVSAAGALVALLDLDAGGVRTLGPVDAGLPPFSLAAVDPGTARGLFPSAITLALVQLMTVISLGKTIASRNREAIAPDRELCAIGLGNLLGSAFAAPPTSASFSRTAVNVSAGARSPLANGFAALAVALAVLFAGDLLARIPLPALAAIIIVAATGMIDLAETREIFDLHRAEGGVAVLTTAVTLLLGIEEGVLLGIGASMMLMLYRASRPRVAVLERDPAGRFVDRALNPQTRPVPGVIVLRIDGALTFANAEHIRRTVLEHVGAVEGATAVVLDGRGINGIDVTAAGVLRDLLDALDARGVPLHLTGFKGPSRRVLGRSRLDARVANPALTMSPQEVVQMLAEEAADDDGEDEEEGEGADGEGEDAGLDAGPIRSDR